MESEMHDLFAEVFGETFAAKIARDGGWARRLLVKAQVAGCAPVAVDVLLYFDPVIFYSRMR